MSATRWHTSPLLATAVVLVGLCLLAVPLHRLTSATPPPLPLPPSVPAASAGSSITAVLRVKLLAPARDIRLETLDGIVLLEAESLPAGESEHDATVALDDGTLALALRAAFDDEVMETAVFLTVLPDGHEEQTRFATGAGVLEETLYFEWSHAHQER